MSQRSSHHGVSIGSWRVPLESQQPPGEYQARMAHKVLEGFYLNGAVVYIDDTVVYGKDAKSFLQMLDLVLDRMAFSMSESSRSAHLESLLWSF